MRRLIASERVKCRAAMTSLAAPVMRELRMKSVIDGTPMANSTPRSQEQPSIRAK
jgi:hypothetical protein